MLLELLELRKLFQHLYFASLIVLASVSMDSLGLVCRFAFRDSFNLILSPHILNFFYELYKTVSNECSQRCCQFMNTSFSFEPFCITLQNSTSLLLLDSRNDHSMHL